MKQVAARMVSAILEVVTTQKQRRFLLQVINPTQGQKTPKDQEETGNGVIPFKISNFLTS